MKHRETRRHAEQQTQNPFKCSCADVVKPLAAPVSVDSHKMFPLFLFTSLFATIKGFFLNPCCAHHDNNGI